MATWEERLIHINKKKAEKAKKKPTEAQARLQRLKKQDPKWVGTTQAEYDSAMVSGKLPDFTTSKKIAATRLKAARTEIKKIKGEIFKLQDIKEGYEALSADDKSMLMPEKKIELESKIKDLVRKKTRLAKIKKKYPDYKTNDPINILDTDLPDQIMIDPKTKKKYRFVGPDRSDPNSYEEI